jgi:hypothetical protein
MATRKVILFFLLAGIFLAAPAWAQHQHGSPQTPAAGGGAAGGSKAGDESAPRRVFILDGRVKADFTITPMAAHTQMLREMRMEVKPNPEATHNIAVTLTAVDTQRPVNEAAVKMKVISPGGNEEVKILDRIPAMNQHSGDFTLAEKGRYQILLLFKAGGRKTAAGFYYRLK